MPRLPARPAARSAAGRALLATLPFAVLSCTEGPMAPPGPPERPAAAAAPRMESDPSSGQSGAGDAPITFGALAPGDVLTVDVDARGCFHHDQYHLVFTGGPAGAVALSGTRTSQIHPLVDPLAEQAFAPRALTAAEIAGLDRLLAYYRRGPGDGCTSWHAARLRLAHGGAPAREEAYTDGSCGGESEGVVSFFALVAVEVVAQARAFR